MNGMVKSRWIVALCTGLVTVVTAGTVVAQPATQAASTPKTVVSAAAADPNQVVDPGLFGGLQYRSLGFSRGGRSTTVAGVPSQPLTFYFGATGGGVWKTINAGLTWQNVSDGFFEAGSIGAIDVAQSDPNVIYVGTGSACPRGNISPGVGVYKSTDAGKTWTHVGLRDAGQVGRVRIHPTNPDLVYLAVLGNIFGPSEARGVYRSRDGGRSWDKVLYINDGTGVVDLAMDPGNPRVLYAAAWTVRRQPWTIDSGSKDGGIFKSTDGGDTWKKLEGGLPTDVLVGRIGITVSPANPDRVWAQVEAADNKGGVYRSDDAGKTWQRVNTTRALQQRAWYYTHIVADPQSADTVYALNVNFHKSTDGGRTFQTIQVPHGDNHDLWINPTNNKVMVYADDGGAGVSLDGGKTWTEQLNQPTAEIYRVTVDSRWPYRVYGAQQDNSTVSVPSVAPPSFSGGGVDFYDVGGCESGHIAVDPRKPNIVYAGCYGGAISRKDTDTGISESVRVYPELQTGHRAADMKFRFQWNAPIRISPHDPDVVYHASQHVHRSRDAGHSWEVISPDLSRNDKTRQDYSGKSGITRDSTGVEVFGVVFALEESPVAKGLLWAGSDDGLMHVSRDAGKTWTNVTPKDMPEFGTVNMIDLSAHDPGRAHVAVHRYRQNDFTPYIFQTSDYGQTWRRLTTGKNGIPANHFVRVVREDPDRKGLLYAGTEFGMYVSFDDGVHWQRFQLNLPVTPITDMLVHRQDLVVSTQGRAFWILDDVTALHQVSGDVTKGQAWLYKPRAGYRSGTRGIPIHYYLPADATEPVKIEILDAKGAAVATFTGTPGKESESTLPPGMPAQFAEFFRGPQVGLKAGLNRFMWNARRSPIFTIPRGTVLWGGFGPPAGPKVVPGTYQAKMSMGAWSQTVPLEVKGDPRISTTQADYDTQLAMATEVGERLKTVYEQLGALRAVKEQATAIGDRVEKAGQGDEIAKAAKALNEKLKEAEGALTQLQGEGGQDALNFPGMLDNQLLELYDEVADGDKKPSKGATDRWADLAPRVDAALAQLKTVMDTDVAAFNDVVQKKNLAPVLVPKPAPAGAR